MVSRCYRALGASDPLTVQPKRPSSTRSPSRSEQPHSKSQALPSTPRAAPSLPVSPGRIAAAVTSSMLDRQLREGQGSCQGTRGPGAGTRQGSVPAAAAAQAQRVSAGGRA